MSGKTHLKAGLLFASPFLFQSTLIYIPAALLGSIIPDLDSNRAIVKNKKIWFLLILVFLYILEYEQSYRSLFGMLGFLIVSFISLFTKHRGFTHSIVGVMTFCFFAMMIEKVLGCFFMLGYISHLSMDFITNNGIELFYPFFRDRYKLSMISTGSNMDYLFGGVCLILSISIVLLQF